MFSVKIEDDDGNIITMEANLYNISFNDNGRSLFLRLGFDNSEVAYLIHEDDRATDIVEIKNFLEECLEKAILRQSIFTITEYLARDYIFVGDGQSTEQFTAQRQVEE